ncbi:hypothetical protein CEXT_804081 [Caerostris extrusa]|uniref:Uncharacterized protein n=1 Tax=Caerostris extrusa TaxID=172846 RepID=A0AAV4Y3Q5_CAEEX|nr:hypothetical protein CEXT_804081 [Caerostris extrusa]
MPFLNLTIFEGSYPTYRTFYPFFVDLKLFKRCALICLLSEGGVPGHTYGSAQLASPDVACPVNHLQWMHLIGPRVTLRSQAPDFRACPPRDRVANEHDPFVRGRHGGVGGGASIFCSIYPLRDIRSHPCR